MTPRAGSHHMAGQRRSLAGRQQQRQWVRMAWPGPRRCRSWQFGRIAAAAAVESAAASAVDCGAAAAAVMPVENAEDYDVTEVGETAAMAADFVVAAAAAVEAAVAAAAMDEEHAVVVAAAAAAAAAAAKGHAG